MITLLSIVFIIASVFLVILVLLQSGKGAGMGIFGGGGSNTTFGAQGGNILTRITTILGAVFFGASIIFAIHASSSRDPHFKGKYMDKSGKVQTRQMRYPADFVTVGSSKKKTDSKGTGTTSTNAGKPGR